jgi:hypothetical protein
MIPIPGAHQGLLLDTPIMSRRTSYDAFAVVAVEIGEAAGSPTGSTETRRVFRYRVNWRQYLCRSIFGLPAASRTGISLEGEAFAALLAPTAHSLVAESRIG